MATSDSASVRASASVFMNAPDPRFTLSSSALIPSASFLLMMLDDEMSGIVSMVAVTSRNAYSRLSSGAISAVWPISAQPIWRSICARKSASVRSVRKPGMVSSLSRVPPVCPRPRPKSWAPPRLAATSGARRGGLVADAAGPVLVYFEVGNGRKVQNDS